MAIYHSYFNNFSNIELPNNGGTYMQIMKYIDKKAIRSNLLLIAKNYQVENFQNHWCDVSYTIYDTDEYFWVLMLLNQSKDIFDLCLSDERFESYISQFNKFILEFPLSENIYLDDNIIVTYIPTNTAISYKKDMNNRLILEYFDGSSAISDFSISTTLSTAGVTLNNYLYSPIEWKIGDMSIHDRGAVANYSESVGITLFNKLQAENESKRNVYVLDIKDMTHFIQNLDEII